MSTDLRSTLKDLLDSAPSAEDLRGLLSRAAHPHAHGPGAQEILVATGLFGAGLVVGAGLALLLAPKPGRELRHEIRERVGFESAPHPRGNGGAEHAEPAHH